MQIAISRQASECVRPAASRFAFDGLDRSYSIVGSVDIYASRPNCSVALSLTYHRSFMTSNKYVEAEQRTRLRLPYNTAVSLRKQENNFHGKFTLDRRRRRPSVGYTSWARAEVINERGGMAFAQ
jgi:hypothetical protein